MLTTVDLFSGAGLMTEGFRQAGFKSVFAAEADSRAVDSFNRNLEPVAQVWDVRDVRPGTVANIIVSGPPCQGFSTLGKRDNNDIRNKLSLTVLDWMHSVNPSVVLIENVPQFVKSTYWDQIKNEASLSGYESCHWILNSAEFGAPQRRVRAFCILSRIGLPLRPSPTHAKYVTVGEAFKGLPKRPSKKLQHIAPVPTGIASERIKLISKNGDKRDVMHKAPHLCPPSWERLGEQAVDVWGRMNIDSPSNTIRCSFQNPSKGRYLHPTENRVITIREGARLQGVPDSWVFSGDRTSMARQIGNGVPVPLAKAVAESIKMLIEDHMGLASSNHQI